MSKTTIRLDDVTRLRLKQVGRKGQSYDELINQLLHYSEVKNPLQVCENCIKFHDLEDRQ